MLSPDNLSEEDGVSEKYTQTKIEQSDTQKVEDSKDEPIDINERIRKIEEKLDYIITNIMPKCDKMSQHIDFVEEVYDHVKTPMNVVCDYIESARSQIKYIINDEKKTTTRKESNPTFSIGNDK